MPTVLRTSGFRFFFYSAETGEPPHIHVAQAGNTAKYWLDPVELASSDGFRAHELNRLRLLVVEHRRHLQQAWHEHLDSHRDPHRPDPVASDVQVTDTELRIILSDGRELSAPLAWFPRLRDGTEQQRRNWERIGRGHGIHWPDLDEDISVRALLGRPT